MQGRVSTVSLHLQWNSTEGSTRTCAQTSGRDDGRGAGRTLRARRRIVTAHRRWRRQALGLFKWFGYLRLCGCKAQEDLGVRDSLEPVYCALVICRVEVLNGGSVRRTQCYGRMNVHLLACMVVFIAASLVYVKKRGLDESRQQCKRHRYCRERSHETLILCDFRWASQTTTGATMPRALSGFR